MENTLFKLSHGDVYGQSNGNTDRSLREAGFKGIYIKRLSRINNTFASTVSSQC